MSFTAALVGCQSADPFTETVDSNQPCVRILDVKERARIEHLGSLLVEVGVPADFAREQMCLLTVTTPLTPYAQAAYVEAAAACGETDVCRMMKRVQMEVEKYGMAKAKVEIHTENLDLLPPCDFNALALVATSLNVLQPPREIRQMLAQDADRYPRFYGVYPRELSQARVTAFPFLQDVHSFLAANVAAEKNFETFSH